MRGSARRRLTRRVGVILLFVVVLYGFRNDESVCAGWRRHVHGPDVPVRHMAQALVNNTRTLFLVNVSMAEITVA